MQISVIVPTFQRTYDLARCLTALQSQSRPADEIVIIARDSDSDSLALLASLAHPPLRYVVVQRPGQVAALNAGLATAVGEILAITDDDAAPRHDWLARIERHFLNDSTLGAVGGRDFVHVGEWTDVRMRMTVGRITWFGRMQGNHHLGIGRPADVFMLKGANMSFHRRAIAGLRFDEQLRGRGAQVHNDMAFCFAVKRRGWKLLYDPAVVVDHYPAVRFDDQGRGVSSLKALSDMAFNESYSTIRWLPPKYKVATMLYAFAIGTRATPGIAVLLTELWCARTRRSAWARFKTVMTGRIAGLRAAGRMIILSKSPPNRIPA